MKIFFKNFNILALFQKPASQPLYKLVWFIPIKKLRDKLRNALINKCYQSNFNQLFKYENNKAKQREIFKNNINLVEIETHSFCNRKCWFCPNYLIDRHSRNIELPELLYLKIINELSEINYSNVINFHRFNEPLSYKELILKRIRQAKEKLPNAKLGIYTNGDYLTTEYLDDLSEAGITKITMSYYFNENEKFNIEKLKVNMQKNIDKLNLQFKKILTQNNHNIRYLLSYKNITIIYKASDFSKLGSDRGGIINGVKNNRSEFSCIMPLHAMYIDYSGTVIPCCDLRSEIKEHENMMLGNINKNTIFELYCSKKASKMRKYLYKKSIKLPPCATCGWYQ